MSFRPSPPPPAFACTDPTASEAAGHTGCLCHRPELAALTARLDAGLSRRGFVAGMAASLAALGLARPARAQGVPAGPQRVLFTNVRLFDGTSSTLRDGVSLLVEGNRIAGIAAGTPTPPEGARVIDGGGRVLMPGLIDMHWHSIFAALPLPVMMTAEPGYIFLSAAAEAERTLMRGFTTIRDLGGPSFPLKQAIDEGLATGPRIYPCGAMITASGGHGDLRPLAELPRAAGTPDRTEQTGGVAIADGEAEVMMRAREQLMQGASQLKMVGGGGVSSPRSPLDASTFTEGEMRAAVQVASDWNTYVASHAYAPQTIRRSLDAGVTCIEHGHLMDEEIAARMAETGVWLSTQPFLGAEDTGPLVGPSHDRALAIFAATERLYALVKKHGIKTAFGSDMLFSPALARRQGVMLTHLARWYSGAEALKMATATNAELLALSGPRNPYPGKLGVLEEGALADMLLVDGNPLEDLSLIADPEAKFRLIMKDGRIHKDTLAG
ncbi:imidazolonepropionase-like amidohydrolase [Ancylobacter sp. 3268]|uniref:metal-dependent hydrolase family protein n=1 Tax=Ancylobacter sp. 3268 TaxID=2817752 RepID=UPI00285C8FA0|nr:amidohydrolase family protein [Ancylobacter sp. 3268]MDR6954927.1 imidazolonepropionase-like amidohydrolase [Ancylobacter sp. 3268]